MTAQTEAQRLASWLDELAKVLEEPHRDNVTDAAAELRRLSEAQASTSTTDLIHRLRKKAEFLGGSKQRYESDARCRAAEYAEVADALERLTEQSDLGWAEVKRLARERDRLTTEVVSLRADVEGYVRASSELALELETLRKA